MSRDDLAKAYRAMRTIRAFEDRVHREAQTGIVPGSTHLYAGQEAVAVGVCMALETQDSIVSTHRGHGHAIAKGCDVHAMMAEILGRETGTCKGKGGSMHIADLDVGMLGANGIVGGSPPIACGAALSAKTLGTGAVSVAFTGDGGVNQGTTAESLNLAMVWTLPVIFVIEDNGFGEATSAEFAVAGDIVARAKGYGMAAQRVDGLSVSDVHEAMAEAVARARAGEGPSLLHVKTERFYGHFNGDVDTYRTDEWKTKQRTERDALAIFRKRLTAGELLDADELDGIEREVAALIDEAVAAAREAAEPDLRALTDDVYVQYAGALQ